MPADAPSPTRPFVRGMRAAVDGMKLAFRNKEVRRAYFKVALGLFALTVVIEGGAMWALWANTVPAADVSTLVLVALWAARILGSIVVLLAGPLIAVLIVNVVFPFFNEGLFMAALRAVDGERAEIVAAGPGMPALSSAGGAAWRLAKFLGLSLVFLLVGLIPVIGGLIAAVGETWLAARTVAWELLDPWFDRLDIRYAEQRRIVAEHREALLGFGLPLSLMLAIPLVGPLLFGLAQTAAATFVVREIPAHVREQPPAPPPAPPPGGAPQLEA